MTRSTRIPTYRRRKDGRAVVTLSGRDHYLGKHGTPESWEAYHRVIAEWLANGCRPCPRRQDTRDDGISIAALVVAFMDHAQRWYVKDGEPTQEVKSMQLSLRPVVRLYSDTAAADFGPTALKACRQQMIDDGLSRTTINNRIARVRRMFRWAVGEELIPATVIHALDAVDGLKRGRTEAAEPEPIQAVEEDLYQAVLPHLRPPVRAMAELQWFTGMRPGEAVIIRSADVDRTGRVWLYRPTTHKTAYRGRDRTIPIGPQAQSILRPWLRADPSAFLFSPAEDERVRCRERREARRTPLRPSDAHRRRKRQRKRPPAERYSVESYGRAIKRGCDLAFPPPEHLQSDHLTTEQKAELAVWRKAHRWRPNQLRHAAATRVRREFGLEGAQVVLGHAQADVTQVYAERDAALAIRIAENVG